MKNNKKSELVVRVQYADNPVQAEAALEILRTGFKRGLLKLAGQRRSDLEKDGEI
ncbi:MAG TPA: hypothetical protein VK464_25840 [Symbiobacteriaceae bacterium]|jgi:hypothetical protein|nr:hypothetical protein [Symbiobacteriaceae bacterium]